MGIKLLTLYVRRQFDLLSSSIRFHSMDIISGKCSYVNVEVANSSMSGPVGPHGSSFVASLTFPSISV